VSIMDFGMKLQPEACGCAGQLEGFSSTKTCVPKVLITGASGYIGGNLRNYLKTKGYCVYGVTSKEVPEEGIYRVDITDSQALFNILDEVKPDAVIHTAALNSLSACEKNPKLAMKLNVETTGNICDAMCKINPSAKLVFTSSDYVFDGERGNYREADAVDPKTVYGRTKVLAENVIKENLENYIICRTSNVYGKGGNFFSFVSEALEQNRTVDVFDAVFFTPTYIDYLLGSLVELVELDFRGVVHVAGRERVSRYDFALKVAEVLGKEKTLVKPVKQVEGLIARDSSLNCEFSRKLLRNYWPSVEESLRFCFGDLVSPYFCSVDNRGKMIGVFQGLKWEEINYVESIKDSVRGNHYHKETTEGFFVIDGKIKVTLVDTVKNLKRTFVAKKGNILIITPCTVHTFEMLENSSWINMLSKTLKSNQQDIRSVKQ
jgi:dTDP-4-dehydrorhamnose reductase